MFDFGLLVNHKLKAYIYKTAFIGRLAVVNSFSLQFTTNRSCLARLLMEINIEIGKGKLRNHL